MKPTYPDTYPVLALQMDSEISGLMLVKYGEYLLLLFLYIILDSHKKKKKEPSFLCCKKPQRRMIHNNLTHPLVLHCYHELF